MFVIIGIIIVIASVLGGFALEDGSFLVLMQIAEFVIIGGAALGALIISAPTNVLKRIISKTISAIKGSKITKQTYLDLLKLMYELFMVIRKDGLIALEFT